MDSGKKDSGKINTFLPSLNNSDEMVISRLSSTCPVSYFGEAMILDRHNSVGKDIQVV